MRLAGKIILSALLATSAFAKDPKVREAWTKTYPQKALSIISDNIGHIVVFGSEIDETGVPTNSAPLLLLNSHGKEIASVNGVTGTIAADHSGRIFVLSQDDVNRRLHCTAFAPVLSRLLWSNEKEIPFGSYGTWRANLHQFIPNEAGGADVFGSMRLFANLEFFVVPFDDANTAPAASWWGSTYNYQREAIGAARAPNGVLYGIGAVTALYTTEPTILTYMPGSLQLSAFEYRPGPPSSRWYSAVACDNDGNPIFGGGYKREAFYRSISQCLIEKRNPIWSQTWSITHTAGRFVSVRSLTVDQQANIIVLCSHGVTKYSPDGQMLWQLADEVATLRVDRSGNVFLHQQVSDQHGIETPLITKLDPDGRRQWQVRVEDAKPVESSYSSGLVCDDKGGVYLAARSERGTTIVRFVEQGPNSGR